MENGDSGGSYDLSSIVFIGDVLSMMSTYSVEMWIQCLGDHDQSDSVSATCCIYSFRAIAHFHSVSTTTKS